MKIFKWIALGSAVLAAVTKLVVLTEAGKVTAAEAMAAIAPAVAAVESATGQQLDRTLVGRCVQSVLETIAEYEAEKAALAK